MMPDQRVVTAEHEAAHAIVYMALGYKVRSISIPDSLTLGPGDMIDSLHNASICMAGLVVEDRYAPQDLQDRIREGYEYLETDPWDEDGLSHDLIRAGRGLEEYGYVTAKAWLDRYADAHSILTQALLAKGELSHDDILALGLEVPAN